jgi:hypothetical protein
MEIYRVYAFTRSLPRLVGVLQSLLEEHSSSPLVEVIRDKYLVKAEMMIEKFRKYQALIEHVVDQSRLPDLEVNPKHDPELADLRAESDALEDEIERLLQEARTSWASFAEVRIERNGHQGVVFRSTKADDERQLRANNKAVQVLSIQKVIIIF